MFKSGVYNTCVPASEHKMLKDRIEGIKKLYFKQANPTQKAR